MKNPFVNKEGTHNSTEDRSKRRKVKKLTRNASFSGEAVDLKKTHAKKINKQKIV